MVPLGMNLPIEAAITITIMSFVKDAEKLKSSMIVNSERSIALQKNEDSPTSVTLSSSLELAQTVVKSLLLDEHRTVGQPGSESR